MGPTPPPIPAPWKDSHPSTVPACNDKDWPAIRGIHGTSSSIGHHLFPNRDWRGFRKAGPHGVKRTTAGGHIAKRQEGLPLPSSPALGPSPLRQPPCIISPLLYAPPAPLERKFWQLYRQPEKRTEGCKAAYFVTFPSPDAPAGRSSPCLS